MNAELDEWSQNAWSRLEVFPLEAPRGEIVEIGRATKSNGVWTIRDWTFNKSEAPIYSRKTGMLSGWTRMELALIYEMSLMDLNPEWPDHTLSVANFLREVK